MKVERDKLENSIEFFDDMLNDLLAQPPENLNIKQFGKHYNIIKNHLAYFLSDNYKGDNK